MLRSLASAARVVLGGLVLLAGAAPARAAEHARFSGTFTVSLRVAADRALTLFDPVGESAWATGWEPVFAREADRATLAEGTVFTTRADGGVTTTWVLQRYDRRVHEIAYTAFHHDGRVAAIRVSVREGADGGSQATVRYDVVATTDAADAAVRVFATRFPHLEAHWQAAIDAALAKR